MAEITVRELYPCIRNVGETKCNHAQLGEAVTALQTNESRCNFSSQDVYHDRRANPVEGPRCFDMTSKIVGNVHSIDGLNAVEVDAIDKADVTVGVLDEEVIKDM